MAVRLRKNGKILCAALHPKMEGDTYIDDEVHYQLSEVHKVLFTDPEPKHSTHGEWWWVKDKYNGS